MKRRKIVATIFFVVFLALGIVFAIHAGAAESVPVQPLPPKSLPVKPIPAAPIPVKPVPAKSIPVKPIPAKPIPLWDNDLFRA